MIRTVIWVIYLALYLIYSLPTLCKVKRLEPSLTVAERDKLSSELPKRWARSLVKLAGAEVTVERMENVPSEGAVLFVSNHQGDFDIPLLLGYIDKPKGFISKEEVRKVPIVGWWMTVINCVFMQRKDRRQSLQAIDEGAKLLRNGHSLVVFPEGTRSKGNEMGRFKAGSFRLALQSNVPIVPVSINGSYKLFEEKRLIQPGAVEIKVGKPIYHREYKDMDEKELATLVRNIIKDQQMKE
ncbi:lysophospholipid acyltransferase family protein [Alkalihalobacterium elongatum]|uniref:lysophospholipid acyltransferase family protein n=1 Tax=Alkalihalobacterium elongatum TaxID=2675466 RepID=UPI001C1FA85B|nr:lysophospholipid acyltransferase family protein [Alkalihalobacterium elongatum]